MWCQLKMSSNKSNSPHWCDRWDSEAILQVLQRLSLDLQSGKRASISHDIPAMSSVLNGIDIYRNVCNHTKAGHHQCAKAISLFLSEMIQMKKGEPENWTKFAQTYVIKHSYGDWSDITTGLIVEQVPMCFLKSIGGPWTEMEWGTATQLTSVSTHICWVQSTFRNSPQFPLLWLAYH